MLTIPRHIQHSAVAGAPITYKWGGTDAYNRDKPDLLFRFEDVSVRCVLALAAGISEWIVWRLDGLSSYRAPLLFIEAVWAGVIAPEYTLGWDWEREPPLKGPVERPLFHTCELLLDVFNHCDPDGAGSASQWSVYLTFLARHVMPGTKPFDTWLRAALERMAKLYPRQQDDPLGEPVSREALEVDRPFDKSQASALLDEFLKGLDPRRNPYLRPSKQMLVQGFRGTPYRYL